MVRFFNGLVQQIIVSEQTMRLTFLALYQAKINKGLI